MDKNTPADTNSNPPPKPIQADKVKDNNFNVHKKPETKDAAPQAVDKKNVDDMDSNNTQKVMNDPDSNSNQNSALQAMGDDEWKIKVSGARQKWNKLQQEELIATCGDSDQLSSLVQKRYSINKIDADKQVSEFLTKQ